MAQTVTAATDIDRKVTPAPPGLLGALPIVNVPPAVQGTGEHGTTAITYLYFDPSTPWPTQQAARPPLRGHVPDRPRRLGRSA